MHQEQRADRSHYMAGQGEAMISLHVQDCYNWLRNKSKLYKNRHDMAIDFGINGTKNFFPLSVLIEELGRDPRFVRFLVE